MDEKILSPKSDVVFKKLFTENLDLLKSFVSSALNISDEEITGLKIINSEMVPEETDCKFSRLDLNLSYRNTLVDIEIQLRHTPDYRDRVLFYWAKLHTSELKSGETYDNLKRTISINIVDFNMFKDREDYHTEIGATILDTGEIFSDKFSIHFFELKKLGNEVDRKNMQQLWLQFLNAREEVDFTMLKDTGVAVMEKAVDVLKLISNDTALREKYRLEEKRLHDEASYLKAARAEGIAEGRAEGRAEGIAEGKVEGQAELFEKLKKLGYLNGIDIDDVL